MSEVHSKRSEAIIAKAEEAFSLDLISESQMEYIVRRAQTDPSYTAIIELPFDWEIDAERKARRKARRKGSIRHWLRERAF